MLQQQPNQSGVQHPNFSKHRVHKTLSRLGILCALLLLAFTLRVAQLDYHPLSGDEAFSAVSWLSGDLNYLLNVIAVIDPQPLVALLSFYAWGLGVGQSELILRYLSVLASMLVVASAFRLGYWLCGWRSGALTALLMALSMQAIWNAQDARQYALWMGLSAFNTVVLIRLLQRPGKVGRWVVFGVTSALAFHTFYLEAFILIVHHLLLLWVVVSRRHHLPSWLLSMAITATLTLPWLLRPALLSNDYAPTGGAPKPFEALIRYYVGPTSTLELAHKSMLSAVAVIVALTIVVVILKRLKGPASVWLVGYAAAPIVFLSGFAWIVGDGYFRSRYTVGGTLALITILAVAVSMLLASTRRAQRLLGISLLVGFIVLNAFSYQAYLANPAFAKAPPWREVAAYLATETGSQDVVVRNIPGPGYDYYVSEAIPATIVPRQRGEPRDATDQYIDSLFQEHERIWFMPVLGVWDAEQVAYSYLIDNAQLLSDRWFGVTRVMQFASHSEQPVDHDAEIAEAAFGEVVTVSGYTVEQVSGSNGLPEFISVVWTPTANSEEPLTSFLHLVDIETGQLVAQDDHIPQFGRVDPATWTQRGTYRDVYMLDGVGALAAGQYGVYVGVYSSSTGERLTLQQGDNAYLLTIVESN